MLSTFVRFSQILFLSYLIFHMAGCSSGKNPEVTKATVQTLDETSGILSMSSTNCYSHMETLLNDPVSAERAKIWYPKLERLKAITEDIIDYIKMLKDLSTDTEGQPAHSIAKSEKVMLVQRLHEYKNNVLNIDAGVMREFENQFLLWVTDSAATKQNSVLNYLKQDEISTPTLVMLLAKMQTEIRIIENRTAVFLSTQFTRHQIHECEFESPIFAQSSSQVRPDDKLTITAGIGSFKIREKTEMVIAGKSIRPNDEGVASYTFAVPQKTGDYQTLVKLSFLNAATGKYEIAERYIKYTVAAPCDTIH